MHATCVHTETETAVCLHRLLKVGHADHEVVDAGKHGYSAAMPARLTISLMRLSPACVLGTTASTGEPIGSNPCAMSFSRTSGAFTAFTTSAFKRSTIALGVPTGTTMEAQVCHSNPGMPAS